jgi:hypothetical protein
MTPEALSKFDSMSRRSKLMHLKSLTSPIEVSRPIAWKRELLKVIVRENPMGESMTFQAHEFASSILGVVLRHHLGVIH